MSTYEIIEILPECFYMAVVMGLLLRLVVYAFNALDRLLGR